MKLYCALFLLLGCAAANAAPANTLSMHAGLHVVTAIYDGYDSNGVLLGDYEDSNDVTQAANGSYTYTYSIGPMARRTAGSQTVTADDNKHGDMLQEFWGNGDQSAKGHVSWLRLSDDSFAAIKTGKDTKFEMDKAENPHTVRKVGEESFTVLVNEKPTPLRTIKLKGAAGGFFWVLDNAQLPMVIRSETTKWKSMVTAISDAGQAGNQIVSALDKSGEATTHAILFPTDSAELDDAAKAVLGSVVQYLRTNSAVSLEIQGHTDSIGGGVFNMALSQRRADAVRGFLTQQGIDAKRLTAKGFGLSVPVADNKVPEGRAQNRRVVFKKA